MDRSAIFGWIADGAVGTLAGSTFGAIAAINLGLLMGIDYEQATSGLFARSSPAGWLVTTVLLAGPVAGVWSMRALRRKRRLATHVDSHSL